MIHNIDCEFIANFTNTVTKNRIRDSVVWDQYPRPKLLFWGDETGDDSRIFAKTLRKTAESVGIDVVDSSSRGGNLWLRVIRQDSSDLRRRRH